jgi:hypothetical protein
MERILRGNAIYYLWPWLLLFISALCACNVGLGDDRRRISGAEARIRRAADGGTY